MTELLKQIPENSRLLGMLSKNDFRPSIAPNSTPINRGRVLFEQGGQTIDFATAVRAPICLLSMGDTELLRKIGNPEEGLRVLKMITENSPTAAVLFDAYRQIKSNPTVVWFAEDQSFALTASRAIGVDSKLVLPLFQAQADNTVEMLKRIVVNKGGEVSVRRHSFSDEKVMKAIVEAINLEATKLDFTSRERKKIGESSAAIVGATHALFPLIEALLGNSGELAAVQGPVHLETNPPNWIGNPALSTVTRFINQSAADWQLNHRSLLPCLINGEPIGEASVVGDDSPQLRRDQKWKLEKWLGLPVFPLRSNPIFGHAIGLIDDEAVTVFVEQALAAEKQSDLSAGEHAVSKLLEKIDNQLSVIKFWK